jgi:hypothetical protein
MSESSIFVHFHSEFQDFREPGAATTGSLLLATLHNLTICSINTTYIDAEVECVRSQVNRELSCATVRARHSSNFPITSLEPSFDSNNTGVAPNNLFSAIPGILPAMHAGYPSPLEAWLANPLSGGIASSASDGVKITNEYTSLPPDIFDARLTVILNTILRGSYRTDIVLGTDVTDPRNYTYDNESGYPDKFGNVTGQWSAYAEPTYRVHTGWLSLYILSIAIMFVCAIGTLVLRLRIRAPDFLNNVSSLARSSPHIRKPAGGSTLDGIQMANVLGNKRVKVGDIKPDDEVGHIVLADEDMVQSRTTLRKTRLYM